MFVGIKGFTLIEMLLVIAIIGILAGAVYTMIGDSDDAKTKSTLSTMKSIMPYAQECEFKGKVLSAPNPGSPICLESETNWPALNVTECSYGAIVGGTTWVANCPSFTPPVTITCNSTNGICNW